MTSYLSSLNGLLSTTTSRYNSLRRNILASSSEDDTNVDHPDATHVSRVLRAYYTEAHRPLPAWLPPDPYKPPPQAQQAQAYVSSRPLGSLRSRTNDPSPDPVAQGPAAVRPTASSGLGDIWGDSPAGSAHAGDGNLRRAAAMGGARKAAGGSGWAGGGGGGGSGGGGDAMLEPRGERRPLPSQRVGSYQSANRYTEDAGDSRPGSAASGSSGRDRLKARLGSQRQGGGGTGSYATQGLGGWDGRR